MWASGALLGSADGNLDQGLTEAIEHSVAVCGRIFRRQFGGSVQMNSVIETGRL